MRGLFVFLFAAYAAHAAGVANVRDGDAETALSCDFNASQVEHLNDAVKAALQKRKFSVSEGQFHAVQSSAFGANPGNP